MCYPIKTGNIYIFLCNASLESNPGGIIIKVLPIYPSLSPYLFFSLSLSLTLSPLIVFLLNLLGYEGELTHGNSTFLWKISLFSFISAPLSLNLSLCPSLSLLLPRFSIAFFFFFSPSLPLSLLYFCHLFFTQVTTWHRRAISQLPPPTSWLFIGHFFNCLSFTFFYLVNRLI